MKNKVSCMKGFTLIELLVVVLIIGILAAVALPQYKKAVIKARLTQVTATMNALTKGIDLYLLREGWPTSGDVNNLTTDPSPLDIEIPGSCGEDNVCRYQFGGIAAQMDGYNKVVAINYSSFEGSNRDGSWFDNTWFEIGKNSTSRIWTLGILESDTDESKAIMCQWLKSQTYIDQDSVADHCEE